MKNQFWQSVKIAFLLSVICSCQYVYVDESETEDSIEDIGKEQKIISFSTDFSAQISPFRNSSLLEDYANTVNWYNYKDNVLKSQEIISDGINTLSIPLKYGLHQVFFVAHNSVNSSFSDATNFFSTGKVTDTFWGNIELKVDENTNQSQSVSLNRIVGKIVIKVTDAIPAEAKYLRMEVENYCACIDVKTGMGVTDECKKYAIEWMYKESNIGKTNTTYSLLSYVPSENYNVNIKIDVLGDANNSLHSKTMKNIPIKANQSTTLTGELFNGGKNFSFSFSPDWDKETEILF